MFDEENNNVAVEETAASTVIQPSQDTPDQPNEQPEEQVFQPVESSKEQNLRILRERAQKLERERDEAIARLSAITQQPDEDDDAGIGDQDLVEGKHINALRKQVLTMKKQLQEYEKTTRYMSAETRLKMEFPDIDSVVSATNVALLREQYPEIAASLASNSDTYVQGKAAYTMIKKLGIVQDKTQLAQQQRVAANASKPRPSNSLSPQQGSSPLTQVGAFENGLTEELRQQLFKEMNQARRGY